VSPLPELGSQALLSFSYSLTVISTVRQSSGRSHYCSESVFRIRWLVRGNREYQAVGDQIFRSATWRAGAKRKMSLSRGDNLLASASGR
jgi:hypothetical protein